MHKLFYLILLTGLPYSNDLFAQDKFEKESRIKKRDVPSNALMFIDSLNYDARVKWYMEEGLTGKSIEAKFKYNKTKYSIEFDTLGNVEDTEMEEKWKNIPPDVSAMVSEQFKSDCSKFKIQKVQKQYTGTEKDLLSILINGKKSEELKTNFEIIVKCHQDKEVNLFEYLFNEKGKLISKSKIVFKNSSHLEY
jgi:hypothetical protein